MEKLYLMDHTVMYELKKNIVVSKYQNEKTFIFDDYNGKQFRNQIEYEVEIPSLLENENNLKQWEMDFENSKKIHSVINSKKIPLRYLTDERFWTYLTHTHFWSYMHSRWYPTNENRVLEKYFFTGVGSSFSRHALVRLWWIAECSYDENDVDPYRLTKLAFEITDPFNQIIERRIGRSRKIFKSVLKAFEITYPECKKLTNSNNRTLLGKRLNIIAGVKIIELLSETDITNIIVSEIRKIINLNELK